jgi:hypothetical protein
LPVLETYVRGFNSRRLKVVASNWILLTRLLPFDHLAEDAVVYVEEGVALVVDEPLAVAGNQSYV